MRVAEQVEIAARYAGYIDRQKDEVARALAQETLALPPDLDYATVRGLSTEARQKLAQHRPETVGQAARIQGITPAAISLLLVHMKRRALAGDDGAGSEPAARPADPAGADPRSRHDHGRRGRIPGASRGSRTDGRPRKKAH